MDMLGHRPIGAELDSGRLQLRLGTAAALADQPGNVMATSARRRAMSVQMDIMDRVVLVKREVVIAVLGASRYGLDDESLDWLTMGDQPKVGLSSEPEVTPYVEFRNMLRAPFVPEQLL